MKREIKLEPAFDKRDSDPNKNYGIHGVNMTFYLHGPKAVVQFVVYTGWHLPHVYRELKAKKSLSGPMPADLGYHAYEPQYDGQNGMECHLLEGKKCYYDGSGLNAIRVFDIMVESGSEGVWKELEKYYESRFGE